MHECSSGPRRIERPPTRRVSPSARTPSTYWGCDGADDAASCRGYRVVARLAGCNRSAANQLVTRVNRLSAGGDRTVPRPGRRRPPVSLDGLVIIEEDLWVVCRGCWTDS